MSLTPTEKASKMLLLPSVYNPVWEYINTRKVEDAFRQGLAGTEVPESLGGKVLLSLKRGYNMYDMYNRENLTVLEQV
jgi:hypothetical protein